MESVQGELSFVFLRRGLVELKFDLHYQLESGTTFL